MTNKWGAFMDATLYRKKPHVHGILQGREFAVKDVFNVTGTKTGGGNPRWSDTHEVATTDARSVEQLLDAGAAIKGKTVTDELMFGLNGQNFHYGTPVNVKAPDRIPGGSSSGSAVAVASGSVDFALGTDTGGSVRVPAAYCGIYGFRPSHGRVSLAGVLPLAPSFDTVGWFAQDMALMQEVGSVLLQSASSRDGDLSRRLYVAEDAFSLVAPELKSVFEEAITRIGTHFSRIESVVVAPAGLERWRMVFQHIQGFEIWNQFGSWIQEHQPQFGPGVAERFQWTETLDEATVRPMWEEREQIREGLRWLEGNLLIIPTVPSVAPHITTPPGDMNIFRDKVLALTSIAGLAGLPQISLPIAQFQRMPVAISLVAGLGFDETLLAVAHRICRSLGYAL